MEKPTEAILVMVQLIPEDVFLQKIEMSIDRYRDGISLKRPVEEMKELQHDIVFYASLFLTRYHGDEKDPFKLIKEFEAFKRVDEMLHPNKQ
jgi:hypothetical protein